MCIFGVVWDSCWCFVSHVKHIHLYRWIFCKKCSILKFTWPVVSSLVTWNWGWTCASSLFNNGLDSMSHGISISASFWHGLLCLTFQCSWIIVSGWKHPILNLDELSRSLGNNLFLAFWMPMCICLTVHKLHTVVPWQIEHPVIRTPRISGHGFSAAQPRESNGKKTRRKGSKMKLRTYFKGIKRTSR